MIMVLCNKYRCKIMFLRASNAATVSTRWQRLNTHVSNTCCAPPSEPIWITRRYRPNTCGRQFYDGSTRGVHGWDPKTSRLPKPRQASFMRANAPHMPSADPQTWFSKKASGSCHAGERRHFSRQCCEGHIPDRTTRRREIHAKRHHSMHVKKRVAETSNAAKLHTQADNDTHGTALGDISTISTCLNFSGFGASPTRTTTRANSCEKE